MRNVFIVFNVGATTCLNSKTVRDCFNIRERLGLASSVLKFDKSKVARHATKESNLQSTYLRSV